MIVLRGLLLLLRVPIAFLWTLFVHWFGVRLQQLFKPGRYLGPIGLWGSGLALIMGVRVRKRNAPPVELGDLIVANHMGFLDVPVILRFFPAVFVIKMEMRRVLYFGRALERQGHVFVDRGHKDSMRRAAEGLRAVLEDGDRIIVFPEGRASPGAERLPFRKGSFVAAQEAGKRVQLCVVDYLPDRRMLEWDVERAMLPQLVDLFGRWRTEISIEFFPPEEVVDDPAVVADRFHDLAQSRLEEYDREREAREARR